MPLNRLRVRQPGMYVDHGLGIVLHMIWSRYDVWSCCPLLFSTTDLGGPGRVFITTDYAEYSNINLYLT